MRAKQPFKHIFAVSLLATWAFSATSTSSTFADVAAESSALAPSTAVHQRLTYLAADVQKRMATGTTIDTRDLANAAFTTLLHGGDPAIAQSEIDRAFSKQDSSAGSPTYGQLTWRTNDTRITDVNAAPFFGQGLAAVLSAYSNRFSPSYIASLRPKIVALTQAISHQPVPLAYTNIYLARAVDLILLGQHLGDSAVQAQGREALQGWVTFTREVGISEFDSSTYYAADVEALSECYRFATANDRKTCAVALAYFWTDIAANYLPSASKLSGPGSREYDFISGNNAVAYWLEGVGWNKTAQLATTNLQAAYIEDLITNGGYKPSESIRAIAFGPPRDVTSTFDRYAGHTRYNWVGRNVSIGCAGGSYGPQDKMLVATFAGAAKSAQLNILLQKSGVAYGIQTASVKPEHISPSLGCLEQGGAAIANFDVDMRLLGPTPQGFQTDVLFPLNASLAINGSPVSLANGDVSMKPGDILAVSSGGGVVALKAIRMDALGYQPTLTLTTDAKATARGAAWLRIMHVPTGGTAPDGSFLRETFIMVARDNESLAAATAELADAAPQDEVGPAYWRASAHFRQGRFELTRSSKNRGVVLPGTIDGKAVARMPLGINFQDVGAGIWQGLP